MGGSLGLAVRHRRVAASVAGCARRPETRRAALDGGVVDEAFERPEEAVRGADLVVFCTPILCIPGLLAAARPSLAPEAVLTDVGSTKSDLLGHVRAILGAGAARFVGSHPICGSEQAGLDAARADLYRDSVTVVTPEPDSNPAALDVVNRLWTDLQSTVISISPADHDKFMARTSHLPHLLAAILAMCVGRSGPDPVRLFCGPGFRSTTRVADGSPEVWHDIFKTNGPAVLRELAEIQGALGQVAGMIRAGRFDELQSYLEEARERRRQLVR